MTELKSDIKEVLRKLLQYVGSLERHVTPEEIEDYAYQHIECEDKPRGIAYYKVKKITHSSGLKPMFVLSLSDKE